MSFPYCPEAPKPKTAQTEEFVLKCGVYSHLSNKRGGPSKNAKSLKLEVGKNMEDGIYWKKIIHNSNKQGVEGGKNLRNQ